MQIVKSDAMKNFMGFATSGVSVSIANVATMPMGEVLNCCCLALVGESHSGILLYSMLYVWLQMSQRSECNSKLSECQTAQSLLAW